MRWRTRWIKTYFLIGGDSLLITGNWGIGPDDVGNIQGNLATVFAAGVLGFTLWCRCRMA
jgi:hypothetical protein